MVSNTPTSPADWQVASRTRQKQPKKPTKRTRSPVQRVARRVARCALKERNTPVAGDASRWAVSFVEAETPKTNSRWAKTPKAAAAAPRAVARRPRKAHYDIDTTSCAVTPKNTRWRREPSDEAREALSSSGESIFPLDVADLFEEDDLGLLAAFCPEDAPPLAL